MEYINVLLERKKGLFFPNYYIVYPLVYLFVFNKDIQNVELVQHCVNLYLSGFVFFYSHIYLKTNVKLPQLHWIKVHAAFYKGKKRIFEQNFKKEKWVTNPIIDFWQNSSSNWKRLLFQVFSCPTFISFNTERKQVKSSQNLEGLIA